jgi:hypothetical protein
MLNFKMMQLIISVIEFGNNRVKDINVKDIKRVKDIERTIQFLLYCNR